VDILLGGGVILSFVVFAAAMFFIKRDLAKKRHEKEDEDV
jgi:hypothetical protein